MDPTGRACVSGRYGAQIAGHNYPFCPLDEPAAVCHVNVINIDMRTYPGGETAMSDVVARIDDFGRPAWIALMVIGFILFWPIGLAILAYIIWSGRMGCGWHGTRGDIDRWRERATERVNRAAARWERKRTRWEERMQHWRGHYEHGLRPSGNHAFDEYREEALRKLEEEATEFRAFLERLRAAKDRAEFDAFMRERRDRQADTGSDPGSDPGSDQGHPSQPQQPQG